MMGERRSHATRRFAGYAVLLGLMPILAGCGTSGSGGGSSLFSSSALDFFSTSPKATTGPADGTPGSPTDFDCPSIQIRTGAATMMISSKSSEGEPSALDLRYQGTIMRMARECQVNAGIMTMKVGVEGRVITGPAGSPGVVELPLRIAVVQEGVTPKTIVSRFAKVTVTVTNAAERVLFTHVDPDITFPLPQPIANLDAYVVYVGFDPSGAPPEKKKPAVKPKTKPRSPAKPAQS